MNGPHKNKMNSKNIANDGISELSNSLQVEEVAMIKDGFKPDFDQEVPIMQQRPLRSMKTRRIKKQKGKRVLKRVYFEANDQQSSYSSLMSEYIDCDYSAYLEVNSNALISSGLGGLIIPANGITPGLHR